MLMQNFYSYLGRSATSVRRSVCDLIGYIQVLKYMPVLICMALFFSSNSHSFNGLIEHASSSTQGSYQAKLHIDDDPDKAILTFSGNTPANLNEYDRYTISHQIKIYLSVLIIVDIDRVQSAIKKLVQEISDFGFIEPHQVIEYKK